MEAKFSNRVKEVISLSREEALRLGHDYIGTEHLLLGVIREGEGVAISLLKKLGISLEDLRASVALVLAAIVSNGKSYINRIYHLDRGYEKIENKVKKIGVKIKRLK